jgi:hypothetical protein
MGKMVCQVYSYERAFRLVEAASVAGMMARIDQSATRTLVTIDHPDDRGASASQLITAHSGNLLVISQSNGLGLAELINRDIQVGCLAETLGISIEEAQARVYSEPK